MGDVMAAVKITLGIDTQIAAQAGADAQAKAKAMVVARVVGTLTLVRCAPAKAPPSVDSITMART